MFPPLLIVDFFCLFLSRSKIPDWCPGLAGVLQPIPFPDEYVFKRLRPCASGRPRLACSHAAGVMGAGWGVQGGQAPPLRF